MSVPPSIPRRRAGAVAVTAALAVALTAGSVLSASAATEGTGRSSLRALAASSSGVRIGTAINTDELGSNAAYDRIAAQQFSSVTPENVMKWDAIEPKRGQFDFTAADELVRFAKQHHQLVRGHTLVWYNQLPQWLNDIGPSLTKKQTESILKQHIFTEMRHFKGKIWQWDVVNEAFNEDGTLRDNLWLQKIGPSYIAKAFTWAHQADPKALLFYNDYNIEYDGPKQQGAYDLVEGLVRKGVPIDGVGFQTHLDTQYGIPDLETTMRRFAKLGLKTAETEVDVRTTLPVTAVEQSAQNAGYAQTLQACLLVKACISYTVWGFGDEYSWIPGVFPGEGAADIYDENLVAKPEYTALQSVLRTAKGVPHRS
ncbi:endo-1,4-beta-xylanase [Amnibacterium soli]|uniref:Beta-xylanase n=1 Tax=Amnibacterium soli TaxID=1282736 RepID=A0ABP8YRL9_9MICO